MLYGASEVEKAAVGTFKNQYTAGKEHENPTDCCGEKNAQLTIFRLKSDTVDKATAHAAEQ